MATPKIVPRGQGEGQIGSSAKGWGEAHVTNVTASSATQGGKLVLSSDDGAVQGNDHRLGVIEFKGAEDTSGTLSLGASIESFADLAFTASENAGKLVFNTVDGTTSSEVLRLDKDKLATFQGVVAAPTVNATSSLVSPLLTGASVVYNTETKAVGALTPLMAVSFITIDGTKAYSLNDGATAGTIKHISVKTVANTPDGTLTPNATSGAWATAAFTVVGQSLTLLWDGAGWAIIGRQAGVAAAANAVAGLPVIAE